MLALPWPSISMNWCARDQIGQGDQSVQSYCSMQQTNEPCQFAGGLADLDSWVLARCPLDSCASCPLQYWVFCIIADHVIGLHQLLVAEI